MFPERPRRSRPPYPRDPFSIRPYEPPSRQKPSILTHFRDNNGQFDLNKITDMAMQVSQLYDQVSPLINKVRKRIKK